MAKLLIVEDDVILCDAYRAKFDGEYEVHFAVNGESGIEQARVLSPDLILLDLYLANRIDGVDVLKKIREDISTREIPVMVITNLPNMEKTVMDLGAYKCLMKSDVDLNMIAKYLDEMLKKRKR